MIRVAAVGKLSEIFKPAAGEYLKRLNGFIKAEVIEVAEGKETGGNPGDTAKNIASESLALINASKGKIIALDSRGGEMTSEGLALFLESVMMSGSPDITFIIGGSNGLSQEVLKKAEKTISFGRFTYPHQLMRVILLEQLYRAYTIINNIKYHK